MQQCTRMHTHIPTCTNTHKDTHKHTHTLSIKLSGHSCNFLKVDYKNKITRIDTENETQSNHVGIRGMHKAYIYNLPSPVYI